MKTKAQYIARRLLEDEPWDDEENLDAGLWGGKGGVPDMASANRHLLNPKRLSCLIRLKLGRMRREPLLRNVRGLRSCAACVEALALIQKISI